MSVGRRHMTSWICRFGFLIWIGGSCGWVSAASAEEMMVRANEQYTRGEYGGAIELYRQILEEGIENHEIYYNLGNAYFKDNQIGQAILSYERALKLDPTDPDARENLRFANLHIRDRIPPDHLPYFLTLVRRGQNWLRMEQVTWLFLALYIASMILLGSWILWRETRAGGFLGGSAAAVFSLALLAGGWLFLQVQARTTTDGAIVIAEKVNVLSGPGEENTLLASIHEGTKVHIHNYREDWVQVVLPDGRAGWVLESSLDII